MTITDEADVALKTKHRAVWASGDYGAVADQVIPALGPELVRAAGVHAGERVLDVAAGTGNAAVPAAQAGARVVATDLTPDLLERGRAATQELDLAIEWREADAERLPFARRRVRRRAVVRRRDVRAAPPAGGRRAGPGGASGRADRPAQLDAAGLHRAAVRHDEAVRRPAPARRLAAAAVGRRGPRPRAARRPGHRRRGGAPGAGRRPVRDGRGVPRLLPRPLRARR